MLAIEWEPVARLRADGIEDLIFAHWRETAIHQDEVPLDPDWQRIEQLERMGVFKAIGARRNGALVGYSLFSIAPHLHFKSTLHATNTAVYVRPDRRLFTAVALVRRTEELLTALGVRKTIYLCPVLRGKKLGALIERLGYKHTEDFYCKLTG